MEYEGEDEDWEEEDGEEGLEVEVGGEVLVEVVMEASVEYESCQWEEMRMQLQWITRAGMRIGRRRRRS